MIFCRTLLFFVFTTLATQASATEPLPEGSKAPVKEPATWADLDKQVGQLLAKTPNAMATLIIADNNAIALQRDYYRPSDTRKNALNTLSGQPGNVPFRLGSITKIFTALALIHATAATNTPLDTPLQNIIDPSLWKNSWRDTHPVQLGQLIELSAGFADISGREFASAQPLPRLQALALDANSHVTHWPPGLQHSYTNLAPAYSALVVEALSGQTFETYLVRHVLKPLGMPTATLQPLANLPGGFRADGKTPIPYWHTLYPAFGGLNTTPREFANFLLKLTRNDFGPELNAALRHRSNHPLWQPTTTAAARAGLALGYGAGIYTTLRDGRLIYGHGGDADGYRSRFGVIAGTTRGYFIAINSDNPQLLRRLQMTIERALIRGTAVGAPTPAGSPANATQHQARLQRFAGEYYPASKRFGINDWQAGGSQKAQVTVVNDRLEMRRGNNAIELIWLGKNLFRRPHDPTATVVFISDNNKQYLQGVLGNWVQTQPVALHDNPPSKAY